ncbi:MAG TPA: acylphosphatase [Candidatus Saccharimonadales bacterium]|nr:acylphosphatase [Candidatus Saccharimonadales bacterium]
MNAPGSGPNPDTGSPRDRAPGSGPDRAPGSARDRDRLEATVGGRVQGVGYRYFVLTEANRLGLTGWVANAADGSVRLVAEGPTASLERLAHHLTIGPPGSKIRDLDLRWSAAMGSFRDFAARSGSDSGD